MTSQTVQRRARRWLGATVAIVLVGDGALLYLHSPAHVVTVDNAVQRYRASTASAPATRPITANTATTVVAPSHAVLQPSAPAGSAPGAAAATGPTYAAPKNGVYTYDTSGFEETDAVGGARHDYPAQTTVTVRPQDCGWVQHWQPLEERWDDVDVCVNDNTWILTGVKTFHEFFRQTQEQDSTCDPGAVYMPRPTTPGTTSTFTCGGSFGAMNFTARVVGPETVAVAGTPTSGLHVHYAVAFTGSNRGSGTYDEWTASSGALLQRTWDMHIVTDSPFGTVHYDEHYKITLTSVGPRT
jgi:hypothetical protein